ncbi:MAG: hypothetical protein IKL44_05765 [Clostridia bacterium]|nr:hypothetical protein [Clostridia bacterium]
MKKFFAVLFAALLIVSVFAFSASAAGTFGANEQKVVDFLGSKETYKVGGKDFTFKIPTNYVNQAKAFFASTEGDITPADADAIIAFVKEGEALVKETLSADASYLKGDTVDFVHFPTATRKAILDKGQKACKVVGLTLVFDGEHVVITNAAGATVFDDDAIIKTTGAEFNYTALIAVCAGFALVVVGALGAAKKARLF